MTPKACHKGGRFLGILNSTSFMRMINYNYLIRLSSKYLQFKVLIWEYHNLHRTWQAGFECRL